ncbi:MAG: Gfo/Idh/MocA family oxidoreductase [Cytophagales bacterium]|nr:Gfo/Idh/MocA family oxidoreductase [Armatimonadota bacterium]
MSQTQEASNAAAASSPQPVRVGIIGAGGMARSHMRQLLNIPGVSITALCDTNPAAFEKSKAQHPEPFADVFTTADHRELLAKDDVDAVVVATPHTLHIVHGRDAVEAGKHILMEKPMVCTVSDAHSLLARLEAYDKIFALAYQRHAMSQFRHMQQTIASGELGAVTFISALQCQSWKRGTAGSWRQVLSLSGGGQINDSGSHLLDVLLWMTGLTVAEVSAFIDNRETPVDINSALAFRSTSGAQGNISIVGESVASWHEDITIWCERGAFFYRNGSLEFCDAEGKRTKLEADALPSGENIDENFIRAIRGEGKIAAPPLCGLRTIELTEAAWRSGADGGRPIKMN